MTLSNKSKRARNFQVPRPFISPLYSICIAYRKAVECAGALAGGKTNAEFFREVRVSYGKFSALDTDGYALFAEFHGAIHSVTVDLPAFKIYPRGLYGSFSSLRKRNDVPHVNTARIYANLKMKSVFGEFFTLAKRAGKY